jgi:Ca2+-binding RTX toxin-like protein
LTTGLDGSIYVGGSTEGGALDGQTNSGSGDAFLTKYSADGTKAWTKLLGSRSWDEATALTTGLDGSIYVGGRTFGAFDGQTNNGSDDAFLTKYSADGTKIWTKLLGSRESDGANALTTGLDGSIYVGGYTNGAFDGQTNNGSNDALLTKYGADGTKIWTKLLGSSSLDEATALTTGLDGSIYVGGVTVGAHHGQINIGYRDAFLSKVVADVPQVTFAAGASTTTLVISPNADNTLEGNETVIVTVQAGAGYAVGSAAVATGIIDDTAPTVTTFSPAGEATAVAIGANIVLTFSETIVARSGGTIELMTDYGSGHQSVEVFSVSDATRVTISGNVVTIDPTSALLPSTEYHLGFNNALADTGGNAFSYPHGQYNFTTGAAPDTEAPTVIAFSPAEEATAVAVDANIVLTFNEAVQRGVGIIVLKTIAGEVVATFNAASSTNLSISGNTLTINPTADMKYSTAYRVELAAGAIQDISGNSCAELIAMNFATILEISGSSGEDNLAGTGAAEILLGQGGNDTLDGGAGDDTLTGGIGADTFVVGAGTDTITDLGNGADILSVATGATANATIYAAWVATAATTNSGVANISTNGLVLSLAAVTTGTAGYNLANTGAATTLTGSGLADMLTGGIGKDTMVGGLGNDTYLVDSTTDVITELLNGGTDTVISSVTQTTLAANVEILVLNGALNLNATGNALANLLNGNAGNNKLDGSTGADTMLGGAGNDTYVVDNAGDMVYESTTATSGIDAGGTDTVQSSVSYALGRFVEKLTLTGVSAINATGNTLANTLVGNGAANTLNGGAGNDTLDGGAGDDSLTGGLGADTFVFGAGTDTVTDLGNGADNLSVASGATANATIYAAWAATAATTNSGVASISTNSLAVSLAAVTTGSAGYSITNTGTSTTLTGSALADTLSGGVGKDTLVGGLGNDTYMVASTTYLITELLNSGTDTVISSVTQTSLAANVENLTLTGMAAINGTGNTHANLLTGNTGNNTLDGSTGADTMLGGAGNDTYVVDNAGDMVYESTTATSGIDAGGTDTVQSSV